jgi:hypothetical protein
MGGQDGAAERASRRLRTSGPGEPRAGFTLVELLAGFLVSGVLAAAVLGLLLDQSRFYERTGDLVYTGQTVRGAVELMTSEVRMAAPEDIVERTESAFSVRFTTHRGIVRGTQSDGDLELVVYDHVENANVTGPSSVIVWDEDLSRWSDAGGSLESVPDGLGATVSGWTGPALAPGARLRVVRTLRYRFAPSSFGPGLALWRGSQELAAPFADGARFEYTTRDGELAGVRILASALPEDARDPEVARDLDYTLSLRN